MGRMLYNLVVTLDLQRISLGGSVFWHHRDFLLPRLQAADQRQAAARSPTAHAGAGRAGRQVGDYAALALLV